MDSAFALTADSIYLVADLVQQKLGVITEYLLKTGYPFCKLPGVNAWITLSLKSY